MTQPEKKIYRILALAVLFFLSGIWFFWQGMNDSPLTGGKSVNLAPGSFGSGGSVVTNAPLEFTGWPDPSQFVTVVNQGETIKVSEDCKDTHLAILIYESGVDYRKDPVNAKYNSASECVDGRLEAEIELSEINLIKDGKYYVIYADQGTDSWYNPR